MYELGSLSLKEKTTMLLAAMNLRVFWSVSNSVVRQLKVQQ
jgi:hypothetical protein